MSNDQRWLGEVKELETKCLILEDEMRKNESPVASEIFLARLQLQECADDLRRIIKGLPK